MYLVPTFQILEFNPKFIQIGLNSSGSYHYFLFDTVIKYWVDIFLLFLYY